MGNILSDIEMEKYISSLIIGDRGVCGDIVMSLLDRNVPVRDIYIDLFTKSLYAVGDLWQANKISVAQEHLATSITESLFSFVYPTLFSRHKSSYTKKAVVACVVNEYHQIGGKIVADILETNGVNTLFLGANTPVKDLFDMVIIEKPDILALSVAINSNLDGLLKVIDRMRSNGFSQLDVIAGGQAFTDNIDSGRFNGISILPTIDALETYIAK